MKENSKYLTASLLCLFGVVAIPFSGDFQPGLYPSVYVFYVIWCIISSVVFVQTIRKWE